MPRPLIPVDLTAMPIERALDLLGRALDGRSDAVLPVASGRAAPLADQEDDQEDPTALVVPTSGSTGPPQGVLLPASALRASAAGTHRRLGGPGHWLLALPTQHIAGVQVLIRSLLAGTVPERLDLSAGFDPVGFAAAATALANRANGRRYTALVPTQLARLLGPAPTADRPGEVTEAAAALAAFDAVLLGGAAAPPALLTRAAAAGINVVTSYGMTETCGGCVYDGVPLDGVRLTLDGDDRIVIGGEVVARGYRGANGAFRPDGDGVRWVRTQDVGRFDTETHGERLRVLGRVDDVIITGGLKVSPRAVEDVVAAFPGVRECLVVGVPDAEWGQRVEVLVVGVAPELAPLRRSVGRSLGRAAAPRAVHAVRELPTVGVGKPDRAAAMRLASRLANQPANGPDGPAAR
jgi:o-succinylbenzoate---CoA ligase